LNILAFDVENEFNDLDERRQKIERAAEVLEAKKFEKVLYTYKQVPQVYHVNVQLNPKSLTSELLQYHIMLKYSAFLGSEIFP
jgi:hypothetical protein